MSSLEGSREERSAAADPRKKTPAGPARLGLLALFVSGPLVVGFLSGSATARGVGTWYRELAKPAWTPPDWLFGPVWTILYVLMGVAAYLAWSRGPAGRERRRAMGLFAAQLALNGLWSVLFFGLQSPGLALVEILLLLVLIGATARAFYQRSLLAGRLFVPYSIWVGFAAMLNFAIWQMNL
ncbi:MAG: TspO/MBR family protein [Thermoanaerobaculia bacterium]|nr:TspO/MBR family protein [Thermoanaerobaculia bacterium]